MMAGRRLSRLGLGLAGVSVLPATAGLLGAAVD